MISVAEVAEGAGGRERKMSRKKRGGKGEGGGGERRKDSKIKVMRTNRTTHTH